MAEFTRSKQITPDEFIDAASVSESRRRVPSEYPWEDKDPDKPKAFNLRLDERTLAKLHWLADYTPGCRSVQGWVKKTLDEAIERGIEELTKQT